MPLPDIGRVQAASLIRRAYEESERSPFLLTSGTKAALKQWLRDNSPLDHEEIRARERRVREMQERAASASLYPTSRRDVLATAQNSQEKGPRL